MSRSDESSTSELTGVKLAGVVQASRQQGELTAGLWVNSVQRHNMRHTCAVVSLHHAGKLVTPLFSGYLKLA